MSRRRSAELYTAASHPLLDGRMGEGEKEWGRKSRRGRRRKTSGRWSIFFVIFGVGGVILTSEFGSLKSDTVCSK